MWFSWAILKSVSRSRQNVGVGAETFPLASMPGDGLSPLQLIHTRVAFTWLSLNSRKCARHQAASNLLPNSFQLFHGVFAPEIQMRLPSIWNWLPLTVMRCA